jgi:hypothetical protein
LTPSASKTPRASALTDLTEHAKSAKSQAKRGKVAADPPGFAQWYQAYPRREAPALARKAYTAALAKVDGNPAVLLNAALLYAQRQRRTERRYVKMPATWLNGECWKDDPTPDRPFDGRRVSANFDGFRNLEARRRAS